MPTSNFELEILGADTPPTGGARSYYGDGVTLVRSILLALSSGSGDDQIDVAFATEAVLAGLATIDINLAVTDEDAFGVAIGADDIFALFIESVEGGAGGTLQVEPGTTNPLSSVLGAGTVLKLPTPTFTLLFCRTADRINVDGTNRSIKLRNTHATLAVTYRVIALCRR